MKKQFTDEKQWQYINIVRTMVCRLLFLVLVFPLHDCHFSEFYFIFNIFFTMTIVSCALQMCENNFCMCYNFEDTCNITEKVSSFFVYLFIYFFFATLHAYKMARYTCNTIFITPAILISKSCFVLSCLLPEKDKIEKNIFSKNA